MKTTFKLLAAAVLVAAGAAQAASVGNLLVNGGFEATPADPNTAVQYFNPNIPSGFGWTVGDNGVELRDTRNFPSGYTHNAYEGSQYIELAVENGNSSILQEVFLELGKQYVLSYAYSPRAPYSAIQNQGLVTLGLNNATALYTFNIAGGSAENVKPNTNLDGLWVFVRETVMGRGRYEELRVAATGGGDQSFGLLFDDFSVVATPLPGAALLFGTSIAGFLAARKRRKVAALAA